MAKVDIINTDLYELFGVAVTASENEIKKAYRKKALSCHPDKNPDNPTAVELFLKLSEGLKVLTDKVARAAYDRVLKGKKAAKLRHRELDAKRKKFKEDLEARERLAKSDRCKEKSDEEKLEEEIERLRNEGKDVVEREMEYLRTQLEKEQQTKTTPIDGRDYKLKIKWKVNESSNKLYNEESLNRLLSKYGDINVLVVSPTIPGSALVEFKLKEAAELAHQIEQGFLENPLKLKWFDKTRKSSVTNTNKEKIETTLNNERDFESLVLRNMRQAEERKRLIEQMQLEDSN